MTQKTGFIGGGNMATALINGMLSNSINPSSIYVADPDQTQQEALLALNSSINLFSDGAELLNHIDTLILAVKPQIMQAVVEPLANKIKADTLIVSVAAGVPIEKLSQWLGREMAIIRCMPNTPSLVGCGASGLFANALVSPEQKTSVAELFNTVGITAWLDSEAAIDHVIAVSGSGPAYFFYLMELMQKTGTELGLTAELAQALTIQTALGAAQLASQSDDNPATLRNKVTSKGGTTAAAIELMQAQGMDETIKKAMLAAVTRATELADEI